MDKICMNCKYLMFSDCYGECDKQLKIVNWNDTCELFKQKPYKIKVKIKKS